MSATIDNLSNLPRAVVSRIVHRVLDELEVNLPWVRVRVFETDHWHHHGHIYIRPGRSNCLIIARVPSVVSDHPHDRKMRGGPPPIIVKTWQVALVCILAHEGTHLRQFLKRPKRGDHTRFVRGKPVKVGPKIFSEVEAEWAEYRFLKSYRERRNR